MSAKKQWKKVERVNGKLRYRGVVSYYLTRHAGVGFFIIAPSMSAMMSLTAEMRWEMDPAKVVRGAVLDVSPVKRKKGGAK